MRFGKEGFDKPKFCKAGKIGAKVGVEVKGKRKKEEDLSAGESEKGRRKGVREVKKVKGVGAVERGREGAREGGEGKGEGGKRRRR